MKATIGERPAADAGRRRPHHWLAIVPALGMLGGVPFVNRVYPLVLGLPLLFAWLVAWVLITAVAMGCVLVLDRRADEVERDVEVAAPNSEVR